MAEPDHAARKNPYGFNISTFKVIRVYCVPHMLTLGPFLLQILADGQQIETPPGLGTLARGAVSPNGLNIIPKYPYSVRFSQETAESQENCRVR